MKVEYELKNTDPGDIEDFLVKVEASFDVKLVGDELTHITNFAQLCRYVIDKIQLDNTDDCTNQQAFYKLREGLSSILQIDSRVISKDLPLTVLLPRRIRRSRVKTLEDNFGFKLNILQPSNWVTGTLLTFLLGSLVILFFNWQIGLLGFLVSIGGLWFANEIGNELNKITVGQLAEKMARENYLKSRRNPKTFNRNETEKLLIEWFSSNFDIDKNRLTREVGIASHRKTDGL